MILFIYDISLEKDKNKPQGNIREDTQCGLFRVEIQLQCRVNSIICFERL
jgi:hypothetical protein